MEISSWWKSSSSQHPLSLSFAKPMISGLCDLSSFRSLSLSTSCLSLSHYFLWLQLFLSFLRFYYCRGNIHLYSCFLSLNPDSRYLSTSFVGKCPDFCQILQAYRYSCYIKHDYLHLTVSLLVFGTDAFWLGCSWLLPDGSMDDFRCLWS